jgi:hypothetical protein
MPDAIPVKRADDVQQVYFFFWFHVPENHIP